MDIFNKSKPFEAVLNKIPVILFLYFSFILALAPTAIPGADAYYYWNWSQHLAWSYYDGPPMIAYFIRLSTLIFGNNLFALNILGVTITVTTAWIMYKTAQLFLDKEASIIATLLWIFSLSTTKYIIRDITYDAPLTLFWALTLYNLISFIRFEKVKSIYLCGVCIGLMMLSKYSGIVLVIAILVFLSTSSFRRLYKNVHFYAAVIVALILFSPVLFWNYQQDWISFTYLSNAHKRVNIDWLMLHTTIEDILPALNVFLIPLIISANKLTIKKSSVVYLCVVVCTVFVGFYLITGIFSHINHNWLGQYMITATLLAGYCYQNNSHPMGYRLLIGLLLIVFMASSIEIVLRKNSYSVMHVEQREPIEAQLIHEFNTFNPRLSPIILAPLWQQAAEISFFLRGKPPLHVLDCGTQNQYHFWNKETDQKLVNKTVKKVLYMSIRPFRKEELDCLHKYFKTCKRTWNRTSLNYQLQVLSCTIN